jgi:hypothetical protein
MRDVDIRRALLAQIHSEHSAHKDTRVISELGLCQGLVRVDVAVINGSIHGYEIKSDRDTLNRLPNQVLHYSRVCDFVSLVTHKNHLSHAKSLIPKWWGILLATQQNGSVNLRQVRKGFRNPSVCPSALVQLLWKDETIGFLQELNTTKGLLSKPRALLWERLAAELTLEDLSEKVRSTLKTRSSWRPDSQPLPSDDLFQPCATS